MPCYGFGYLVFQIPVYVHFLITVKLIGAIGTPFRL